MFSNPLPDDEDYLVQISDYAARHYLKRFEKTYKGKQWLLTLASIEQGLKRVHALAAGQRVDELKRNDDCLLFKYDFAIAQTKVSAKAAGNRCIIFLDMATHVQTILLMYSKTDLPKNMSETAYIMNVLEKEHSKLWQRLL
jgi:hypothetical protein